MEISTARVICPASFMGNKPRCCGTELTCVKLAGLDQHVLHVLGADALGARGVHRVGARLAVRVRVEWVAIHAVVDDVIANNPGGEHNLFSILSFGERASTDNAPNVCVHYILMPLLVKKAEWPAHRK